MLPITLLSSANDQANDSVNCNWSQPPALTVSEFNQDRFEKQPFPPASPASAEIHRNRIEELLFSPTSSVGATLDRNPLKELLFPPAAPAQLESTLVEGPPFSPPSPGNETMPTRNRDFHIPQPLRSFDELHTERSYLLDCLQIENSKATKLLRSIPPLEEQLTGNDRSSFNRGKVKKRLGWLRGRLNETNRQEKRILAQLGQVTFEIQTRERWTQIEYERRQREVELHQHYCNGLHDSLQPPLNQASPVFQLQGNQMPYTPWPPDTWQKWVSRDGQEGWEGNYRAAAERTSSNSSDLAAQCSPSDERAPDDLNITPSPSSPSEIRRCSLIHRSSSLNNAVEQLGVFSTNNPAASVSKVRRLSLPIPPVLLVPALNIWAPTPEEKDSQDFFKGDDQVECS